MTDGLNNAQRQDNFVLALFLYRKKCASPANVLSRTGSQGLGPEREFESGALKKNAAARGANTPA